MSGKIITRVRRRQEEAFFRREPEPMSKPDEPLVVEVAPYRKPPKVDPYRDLGKLSGYGGYLPDPPKPLDPISRFFRWMFRL